MSDKDLLTNKDMFETVFLNKVEVSMRERTPLQLTKDDATLIRESLIEKGINIEISEKGKEYLVHGSQFRARVALGEGGEDVGVQIMDRRLKKVEGESRWINLQDLTDADLEDEKLFLFPKDEIRDKGLGLIQMLGRDGFSDLISFSYREAIKQGYTEKLGHKAGTEGRGLHQTAADFLALAVLDPDSETYEEDIKKIEARINTRTWAGYREVLGPAESVSVDKTFETSGVKKPTGKVNGYPPESTVELLKYMTGRENRFGQIEEG